MSKLTEEFAALVEEQAVEYKVFNLEGERAVPELVPAVPLRLRLRECRVYGAWWLDRALLWNMESVEFTNCIFDGVKFDASRMTDVSFNDCVFVRKCQFRAVHMNGVEFETDCRIELDTNFINIYWNGPVFGLEDRVVVGGRRGGCVAEGDMVPHQFVLHRMEDNRRLVEAGCRLMSVESSRRYWGGGENLRSRQGHELLNQESLILVDEMMRRADLRGWRN